MMNIEIRNAVFTSDGRIDCEINHPSFGWVPFTADQNDVEEHGRIIFEAASAIPPAPAPDTASNPKPVPEAISFAQLLIGLVSEQWITETAGEEWLQGILPSAVLVTINLLPREQQFAAKARAARPSEIRRDDPLVGMMAAAQGKTVEEVDDFFRTYASV